MKDDPVIQRVREARCQISQQCGHDPEKLIEYYIKRQMQHKVRLRLERETVSDESEKG